MYKVIVVDDEQNIREGIQDLLDWETMQCEVVRAFRNGEQVVEYLKDHSVDIIVTDIKMPVMDGIMLARYIYENRISAEVIFLTAYSDFTYAQKAIKYKVADFVIKNNFMVELPKVIEKVVDKLDSGSRDMKVMEPGAMREVRGRYRLCMGEVRYGYKINVSEKITDLEKIMKVSIHDKDIFLFYNDEASFYIIIEGQAMVEAERSRLKRKLVKFATLTREFLQLELRLGVSDILEAEQSVFRGKKQAMQALGELLGPRDIISFYEDHEQRQTEEDDWDVDQYMRRLLRAIKDKNAKEVEEKEEEYRSYLASSHKLIEQHKSDTHAIASYLLRKFRYLYPDKEPLLVKESIFETIYLARSKAALLDVLQDVCQTMQEFWGEEIVHKNALVEKVHDIIRKNYQSKLSLKEISQKLFVNGSYLSRVYKKETNDTITDAINKYRISRAKELLAENEYKIYEVGSQVGIEDPAYFTHIFFKYEGETPSDYMNRCE